MTTGEKIKKLRNDKMMTQAQLVGDHITRNMLSRIESNEANPSLSTLLYIADRLGVPAGYLLADEKGDAVYAKSFVLDDIKMAFNMGNYRICRELCVNAGLYDDEIVLVAAEATFALAVEEFNSGFLYRAVDFFDEAISYCEKTSYYTEHIKAAACMYLRYMRGLSPNLTSSVIDENTVEHFCAMDNRFCRYIYAVEGVESSHTTFAGMYIDSGDRDDPTVLHLGAKIDMLHGNYRLAASKLNRILTNEYEVGRPLLYAVLSDLESCCKSMNDYRGAYEYSNTKIDLLQKMLLDD